MDPVDGGFLTDLALLDLVSDTTVRFADISSPRNAAFSPDGHNLAVQIHHQELRILTLDGDHAHRLRARAAGRVVTRWKTARGH
jgi:hypothetical protein